MKPFKIYCLVNSSRVILLFVSILFINNSSFAQTPIISSFSPSSDSAGSIVTIIGSGFNSASTQNVVYFGSTKALVNTASTTALTVTVPLGATHSPIAILNLTSGLIGYSLNHFFPTFKPNKSFALSNADFDLKLDSITLTNPQDICLGDFDLDGKSDIAIISPTTSSIAIHKNTGTNGSMSFSSNVNFSTTINSRAIALGDFDGDGRLDLAATNNSTVSILRNTSVFGTISFATKIDFTTGTNSINLEVCDINSDGKLDIVVANFDNNTISVLRNTSVGGIISFATKVDFSAGQNPVGLAVGDLNGDTKLDIAITNFNTSAVSILRNTSVGSVLSFATLISLSSPNAPFDVKMADMDSDGKLDLTVLNSGSNLISVFRNTSILSAISFATKLDYGVGVNPRSMSIGDLDGDGKLDITATNQSSNTVSILRNTGIIGNISFQTKVDLLSASEPRGVSIGDLNGDGKSDIVTVNSNAANFSIFRYSWVLPIQPPQISSFSPKSGENSSIVTIYGFGFHPYPDSNFIFMGAARAVLNFNNDSSLMVTVPNGATFGPISITNTSTGLTTISQENFTPTYTPNKTKINVTDYKADKIINSNFGSSGISISDLNGDGTSDLAIINYQTNKLLIFSNTSSLSGISFAPRIEYTTSVNPFDLFIGDLNADGKPDIAVTNHNSNSVSVFRNTSIGGTISFANKVDFATGNGPFNVTMGDLDGDGRLDLAVANGNSHTASVLKNTSINGIISFAPKIDYGIGFSPRPYSLKIGDLNGDKKPDLIVANNVSFTFTIFRNISNPGVIIFAPKVDFVAGGGQTRVCLADFNEDGKLDMAIANRNSNNISVYRNLSLGDSISFAPKLDFATALQPQDIEVSDLNGDGKPDLLAANQGAHSISIFINKFNPSNGQISFTSKVDFPSPLSPVALCVGDIGLDNKPEIAVANVNSDTLNIFSLKGILNNTISTIHPYICQGSTISLLGSMPIGGNNTTYNYSWLSSTISENVGFTPISLATSADYTAGPFTQNTWFRRVVTSGPTGPLGFVDTSDALLIKPTTANFWTGASSSNWGTPSNWGCGYVPMINDSVVIISTPNQPIIIDGGRITNFLYITPNASLSLNNFASKLTIMNKFTNEGIFNHVAGELIFGGNLNQQIPQGNYNRITVNNPSGVNLNGNITLYDSLKLNNGLIKLGPYNLTLASNPVVFNFNSSRYIQTNGTGKLVINNLGITGRTGAITFPIGNTTFNPITLTNLGSLDNYGARIIDSVINPLTGAKLVAGAVERTWVINEETIGGSNVNISLQWNSSNELPSFNRANSYVALFSGNNWFSHPANSALGTNPFTQSRAGINNLSNFSVGSNGILPVNLIDFKGTWDENKINLFWTTAKERNNSHFIIERSIDKIHFDKVGKLDGWGNTDKLSHYIFTDTQDLDKLDDSSILYYRLQQNDYDGNINYHGVIAIKNLNQAIETISISPNPFNSQTNIKLQISYTEIINIKVVNLNGEVVLEQESLAKEGQNSIELFNSNQLNSGIYFVWINSSLGNTYKKIVKL